MACFTFAVLVLALAGQVAASPFQYPFGGLAATFSETLAPGACAGIFVGVETNFTCPCVTSESSVSLYWFWRDARDLTTLLPPQSSWINCFPTTADQVETYCTSPVSSGACVNALCPDG